MVSFYKAILVNYSLSNSSGFAEKNLDVFLFVKIIKYFYQSDDEIDELNGPIIRKQDDAMKRKIINTATISLVTLTITSCTFFDKIEEKAAVINQYEKVALNTINENRALKAEITNLNSEIEKLKTQNQFLTIKLNKDQERAPASIAPLIDPQDDKINNDIYKWTPEQLLGMAETAFDNKDYENAAQAFMTFRSS